MSVEYPGYMIPVGPDTLRAPVARREHASVKHILLEYLVDYASL